jgi:hypothetical protein
MCQLSAGCRGDLFLSEQRLAGAIVNSPNSALEEAMRYCIQPATSADVAFMALAMDPDTSEWGNGEAEYADRLLMTCATSTQVWAARDTGGMPCALWGVAPKSDDMEVGCVWLLACEQFEQEPNDFRDLSGLVFSEMLGEFSQLENFVDVRKERAVELLRSIGFTVEPAATHFGSGTLCHRVVLEAGNPYAPPVADHSARLN